ncbi:hypothetical protein M441DRAFT_379252 [Trichoderma asperellum CBS 433.97]|uniref:Uncharacterized protein n=1 Tax=Trichoderma asperellum (strain ATCC 204424 / CBS 433.97 / NBRC 101777) TaxID=1042311 RepID=A0A2T3ZAZ0_TRIA4|nr:hypothetical protein M441DRAFT_379252 [Trichoderma asperellum CBS 433.97]PTB41940.1 hypothetical protein M441DRAFT_379252 [Trichoderma asperellum CBS 433.97]
MVAQKNICRLERSSLVLLQLSSFLTKGRVVREGEVVSFFLFFFFSFFHSFPLFLVCKISYFLLRRISAIRGR